MGEGQRSTGNAKRGSYKGSPGVGTSNFYLDNGSTPFDELLRRAEGGVLIAEVSGVHSGANPISGEFSVGATGLRIEGGALGEPLREMTIALDAAARCSPRSPGWATTYASSRASAPRRCSSAR